MKIAFFISILIINLIKNIMTQAQSLKLLGISKEQFNNSVNEIRETQKEKEAYRSNALKTHEQMVARWKARKGMK